MKVEKGTVEVNGSGSARPRHDVAGWCSSQDV